MPRDGYTGISIPDGDHERLNEHRKELELTWPDYLAELQEAYRTQDHDGEPVESGSQRESEMAEQFAELSEPLDEDAMEELENIREGVEELHYELDNLPARTADHILSEMR